MAGGRKYATLPDLDSAPDVYETQSNADSASVAGSDHHSILSSTRSSLSIQDLGNAEDDEDDTIRLDLSGVEHHKLDPSRAREHFGNARVDARDVDFSDRITGDRVGKSYRVASRKRNRRRRLLNDNGEHVLDDSDSEEEETFEKKLARLRREVEEVRLAAEKETPSTGNGVESDGNSGHTAKGEEDIAELSRILRSVQSIQRSGVASTQQESNGTSQREQTTNSGQPATKQSLEHPSPPPATQHASSETQSLSKAITLESRLASLEATLGINALSLPNPSTSITSEPNNHYWPQNDEFSNGTAQPDAASSMTLDKPILTTLTVFESTLHTLTHTSASALTSLSEQIAEIKSNLSTRQPSASASAPYPLSRPASFSATSANQVTNPAAQTNKKLEPLYNSLPTLHALAPLLPATISRLRSLRDLHSDAAGVRERMEELEKGLTRHSDEIRKWREAVDTVEQAVDGSERGGEQSQQVVEGWVRNLESRMAKFDAER